MVRQWDPNSHDHTPASPSRPHLRAIRTASSLSHSRLESAWHRPIESLGSSTGASSSRTPRSSYRKRACVSCRTASIKTSPQAAGGEGSPPSHAQLATPHLRAVGYHTCSWPGCRWDPPGLQVGSPRRPILNLSPTSHCMPIVTFSFLQCATGARLVAGIVPAARGRQPAVLLP